MFSFFSPRGASAASPSPPPPPPPPQPPPPADRALALLLQAEEEDKAGNLAGAIPLYEGGVQTLLDAIKLEVDDNRKKELRSRAAQCLGRAETIKEAIKKTTSKPAPQTALLPPRPAGRPPAPLPPRVTPQPAKAASAAAGSSSGRGSSRGGGSEPKPGESLDSAIVSVKPNVRWDDVAGLEKAKAALQEAVVLPIRFPSLFTGERRPWRGILLYGPPGTGKSHLAKAVATEVDATFFSISSSDLVSKWVGESEKLVRALFEGAERHRPSIIFIDEVDALCSTRSEGESDSSRRLKNELLVRMSDAPEGVLVLGATNLPWGLDPAVRRRFEKRVFIPLPDATARLALLRIHLGQTPHQLTERALNTIAQYTEGLSGADMSVLVRDALMEPVRGLQQATHFRQVNGLWEACGPRDRGARQMSLLQVPPQQLRTPVVTDAHFERVLQGARPSVGSEDNKKFDDFTREFGSG